MKKHPILQACLFSAAFVLAPVSHGAVVMSWDFDTDAEGWGATNTVAAPVASGGFLTATATAGSNDPQLTLTGVSFTPAIGETWTTLTFRVRETDDNPSGLVTEFNNVGVIVALNGITQSITSPANGTTAGDGWFEVVYDISGFGAGTGEITGLRVDPIGGASSNSNSQTTNNFFEVDYIRISDTSVIPEPSTTILGAIGSLMLLRRRR